MDEIIPAPEKEPEDKRGCIGKSLALAGLLLSTLYLLNLSAGIVEIPDNLPIVGNIDEAAATAFLLACLRYLGIDLLPFRKKEQKLISKDN